MEEGYCLRFFFKFGVARLANLGKRLLKVCIGSMSFLEARAWE